MEEEKSKSTKDIINVLKNFIIWFLITLYLETIYRFSMELSFSIEVIINVTLYSLIVSSFLSIISRIFEDRVNNWITGGIILFLGILFSTQCVFTKIFTTNFALSNLALGDQAAGFIGDAFKRDFSKYYIYYFFFTTICFFPYI